MSSLKLLARRCDQNLFAQLFYTVSVIGRSGRAPFRHSRNLNALEISRERGPRGATLNLGAGNVRPDATRYSNPGTTRLGA